MSDRDTEKNSERQPLSPPPRPKRVAESTPPPRPKRDTGSPPPRPKRGTGGSPPRRHKRGSRSSSAGRSRTLSKRTLIFGGVGLLCVVAIVAGLGSLFGLSGPATTTAADYTSAEVKEIVRLLIRDPECRDTRLRTFRHGPISVELWEAILGKPEVDASPFWTYRTIDGTATIRVGKGMDDEGMSYLLVNPDVKTVSVGPNTMMDPVVLKKRILRIKSQIDPRDSLAFQRELKAKWEQEQAKRAAQLAEEKRQQKIEQAKGDEEGAQQDDRIAAEKDSWNLKDELPLGLKDAFVAQSDDWITRRAAAITEARRSGKLTVREKPVFGEIEGFGTTREYVRNLPLPTKEAVSAAISDGKPIPVVGAGASDATTAQKQTPPPPDAEPQPTADAGTSIKPKAATQPKPDVPTSKPPTTKTREQQIAELTKKALNKRVSLTAPYPASYKGAPRDKMSVQYAVIEIAKQAGFQYDFKTSFKNTDPICRKFITPKIRNKTCREALESILRPVGLTYRTDAGVIVLVRR